jgi:uncharacterized radical SAM superfamily protein
MFIDDNDTVFSFPSCLDRTIDHTGRTVTLIAEAGKKVACHVWISPLFNDLYPGTIHTEGNTVFCLAGNRTAVTTDAPSKINDHRVVFFVHPVLHISLLEGSLFL